MKISLNAIDMERSGYRSNRKIIRAFLNRDTFSYLLRTLIAFRLVRTRSSKLEEGRKESQAKLIFSRVRPDKS